MQTQPIPQRRPPTTIPRERSAHDAELVDEMKELLDAIDGVLDENAMDQ